MSFISFACGTDGANGYRVKLPKSFVAINLSEKVPDAFGERKAVGEGEGKQEEAKEVENGDVVGEDLAASVASEVKPEE